MGLVLPHRLPMCAVICSLIGYETGAAVGELFLGDAGEIEEVHPSLRRRTTVRTYLRAALDSCLYPVRGGPLRRSATHAWTSLYNEDVNIFGRPLPRERLSRIKMMTQHALPMMLGVLGSLVGEYVGCVLDKGLATAATSVLDVVKETLAGEQMENPWGAFLPDVFAFDFP